MAKLHQIIAVEKTVKNRVGQWVSEAKRALGKPALFDGLTKTYQTKDEDGEAYPDEHQLVQFSVKVTLREMAKQLVELFDLVAAKDEANCHARANVVIGEETLLTGIPATHLLFLEKQFTDIAATIDTLPVLDPAYDWKEDQAETGLHRSDPRKTTKMKKVQKPIVKYDATEHHPAQTELISVDEIIGWWTTVKHCGALTVDQKKALQARARALIIAVKFAREEANEVAIEKRQIGNALFSYLFADL